MLHNVRSGRWLIASAFLVASCSQGDTPRLTSPTAPAATAAGNAGIVGGLALGDVRVGPATIEIDSVQLDRQTPEGASILRQYANPGIEYRMELGETIQIWVEYDRGDGDFPSGVAPTNRRLRIDWGEGEIDRFDFTSCGACKLKHTYPRTGRYMVNVTLDDLNGTTVTRTFFLNSVDPTTCVPASSVAIPNQGSCLAPRDVSGSFTGSDLVYSLDLGACGAAHEVVAAGSLCAPPTINSATGVITFSGGCSYCFAVRATNGCGATSQILEFCD